MPGLDSRPKIRTFGVGKGDGIFLSFSDDPNMQPGLKTIVLMSLDLMLKILDLEVSVNITFILSSENSEVFLQGHRNPGDYLTTL